MPKRYTQAERQFVWDLAVQLRAPFTHLESILRALAQMGLLGFLGPKSNERFRDFPAQRAYDWAQRYDWPLEALDGAMEAFPGKPPKGPAIDDMVLRYDLNMMSHFYRNVLIGAGDPYQNLNAYLKARDRVYEHNRERESLNLTEGAVVFIVQQIVRKLAGGKADEETVMRLFSEELGRFYQLPAGEVS